MGLSLKELKKNSTMSHPGSDINSIRPLYKVANYLGLVPPYKAEEAKINFKYKCYCAGLTLIIICAHIRNFMALSSKYKSTTYDVLMIFIAYNVETFFSIVNILLSGFGDLKKFKLFINRFEKIDEDLKMVHKRKTKFFDKTMMQFVVVQVIIFGIFLYDFFAAFKAMDMTYYLIFLLSDYEHYMNVIMVLLIYNYALSIKLRFEFFNKKIRRTIKSYLKEPNKELQNKMCEELNKINRIYKKLTELVINFNEIFGWPIFILCFFIGFAILDLVQQEITYNMDENGQIVVFLVMVVNAVS